MIALMDGIIDTIEEDAVILLVGGIGYRVYMPVSMIAELDVGHTTRLYTHQHVREDAILLYGFTTDVSRKLFLRLQSASGIGPKVAVAMLHHLTSVQIVRAVQSGDVVQLTQVPGVGAKTAQRLILELKDRVADLLPDREDGDADILPIIAKAKGGKASQFSEVSAALLGLGFIDREIQSILQDIGDEIADKSIADGVKQALRALAR